MEFNLFLDSGAHMFFNKYIRGKARPTYEWMKEDDFKKFAHNYCKYLQTYGKYYDVYANLDIIFNPQETWNVQKKIENKYGLKPMPVYHFGEDIKWLYKYMDEYEYIGIGGLGQHISAKEYVSFGDTVFKEINKGSWKTHGFAMTSFKLMQRYNWHSVDSSSWLKLGAYGKILIPKRTNGKWDLLKSASIIAVSEAGKARNKSDHFDTYTPLEKESILSFIKEQGFVMGESVIEGDKEIIIENGLCNNDVLRYDFNAMYYLRFAKQIGINLYLAGAGRQIELSSHFRKNTCQTKGILISAGDCLKGRENGKRSARCVALKKGDQVDIADAKDKVGNAVELSAPTLSYIKAPRF